MKSYTFDSTNPNQYAHFNLATGIVDGNFNLIVDGLPTVRESIDIAYLTEMLAFAIQRQQHERKELNYAIKHGSTLECSSCGIHS